MRAGRQFVDGAQLDDAAVAHLAFALAVAENFSGLGGVFAGWSALGSDTLDVCRTVKGEKFFRAQLLLVRLCEDWRCGQSQQADQR